MLGNRVPTLRLLVLLLALSVLVGCPPKTPPDNNEPPTVEPTPSTSRPPAPSPDKDVTDVPDEPDWGKTEEPTEGRLTALEKKAQEINEMGVLQTVYFATDKSDLSAEAREIVANNASWLRSNTEFRVVVEGHCDDRNTEEYNLALGERRADAVRSYLVSLGVDAGRIETISYGEERPVALGNDESAWSQNRRAAFVVKAP